MASNTPSIPSNSPSVSSAPRRTRNGGSRRVWTSQAEETFLNALIRALEASHRGQGGFKPRAWSDAAAELAAIGQPATEKQMRNKYSRPCHGFSKASRTTKCRPFIERR